MPKHPSSIIFTCEACNFRPKLKCKVLRDGQCKKCNGSAWTLSVEYTETETNRASTALGLVCLFTIGAGWTQQEVFTNRIDLDSVSGETVRELMHDKNLVADRVMKFIRICNNMEMEDKGAVKCKQCQAVFIPSARKTWTTNGYCSVSCSEDSGVAVSDDQIQEQLVSASVPKLQIACPNGHQFSVLASFAGCLRPCPNCKAKCEVPS